MKTLVKKNAVSGTKEWSVATVNFSTGCKNNCRYCYARQIAVDRFKRVKPEDWGCPRIRVQEVQKRRPKYNGIVMMPSTHDIYEENLEETITVLENLLSVGNTVLVVSKPRILCVTAICSTFAEYKDNLRFRFSIGCMDNEILNYWEPNAPSFQERLFSLVTTTKEGFSTSVSIEPMLQPEKIVEFVNVLDPAVTDSIWVGKMNQVRARVKIETEEDRVAVENIEAGQSDENILAIYDALKDNPKIRWKESIKRVVGLELADEAGMDI